MIDPLTAVQEGSRLLYHRFKNQLAPKTYDGNAAQICQQIVHDCWNGHYFQTSTHNFAEFWSRDFGWCAQSLMKLGYEKEVHHTLRFALNHFQEAKNVTATISPSGKPYDFPVFAVDSLPWLIHSISISKFPLYSYRNFLNQEIQKFFEKVINPATGLVKPDVHFSSMKDLSVRKSSCYDNCMVALLAKDLQYLELHNPFKKYDYPELLMRHFWNGKYFYDDLTKQNYIASDANLFPLLFGFVKDPEKIHSIFQEIQKAQLDQPFPLKYTQTRHNVKFVLPEKVAMRDYESNAIWTHMGLLWIKIAQNYNKELGQRYKEKYRGWIEEYHTFWEVFTPEGQLYKTWFYHSSPGMLWAANYLML